MWQSFIVLLLTGLAIASPVVRNNYPTATSSSSASYATCRKFYADVYAASNNTNLSSVIGAPPANQQVLVQSQIDQYASGSNFTARVAAAPQVNVSGSYQLAFEYCTPKSGNATAIFQTMHGLVGNAAYWNVVINGSTQYSFAEAAAQAGYATLSYDRLGVGNSSKPDGTNIVQISYETAQAISISQSLRAGNLSGIPSYSKVIGVGHSYGSILLTGVASRAPTAFDAIVLTGFVANATAGPLGLAGFASTIANVAYPSRFANDANDYVSTPTVSSDQMEFFHYPNYTQAALTQFTTTKGEYTLGQLYSIAGPLGLPRQNYNRPLLVVTGSRDAPFCASTCETTSLGPGFTQLDTVAALFPSVARANFSTYLVPDTAHGINFHTTAPAAYAKIFNFTRTSGF